MTRREDISLEAIALLREVSEDPEQAIYKLSRHALGRRRAPRGSRLAEQELASVFRVDVARILARHAQEAQFRDPYWDGLMHRSLRAGEELELADRNELSEYAGHLLSSGRVPADAEDIMRRVLYRDSSPLDLAQASFHVLDTDFASMLLAFEYMRLEEWESCKRCLQRSIDLSSGALNRSIAWEQTGSLMIRMGRVADAIDAYQRSAEIEPGRPFPLLLGYLLCGSTGFLERARRFAEEAEEFTDESDLGVAATIRSFVQLGVRGFLAVRLPSGRDRERLVRGPVTARILHALP